MTDSEDLIKIWAWPIEITVREIDFKIDDYKRKEAYLVAETFTYKYE